MLLADKSSVEAQAYLRDVQDCLEQSIEDLHEIGELCQHLIESHKSYLEQKSAYALSVLTVVTTTLLPIQILSGVYGMNFQKEDGSPGIPELMWENGYMYFWGLSLGLAMCACLFLWRLVFL